MPAETPVITPVDAIVATLTLILLHVPPAAMSLNDVFAPVQNAATPVIVPAAGNGFTVITTVAAALPQLLVTV